MRWIVAFLACIGIAQAQIIQHQISDDGYVRVPLQFPFPYYGRVFTESYMFSNGVVGFLNPTNSWCCTGFDLTTNNGTPFSFAIMPLQTDLINYSGRFLTEGTPQYQRYAWENISEYGVPQNLNTFGVEIRPSGYIGMHYEQVNISPWRPVTIGMTGDVGEFSQFYHGSGFLQGNPSNIIASNGNLCVTNPLSSPTCSGYQEAYLAQQCSISPLYSPQCPNYEQAYQDYQCSLNALYSPSCVGYEQAYFNQQCSINALFNSQCSGYQDAYYAQQCSLNGLYDSQCPNYAEAYALANIVSPTRQVAVPQVQISTTGVISVDTPVVADPIVNEVITRPNVQNPPQPTVQSNTPQAEPKADKKQETKQAPKPTATAKGEIPTQVIPQPVYEYKAPIILDLAYQRMVKKPIKDNNKAMYNLIMNSQIKHEEMVDEQYRRKRN